jgi:hypothetical protein
MIAGREEDKIVRMRNACGAQRMRDATQTGEAGHYAVGGSEGV